jgi:hypothetical protein
MPHCFSAKDTVHNYPWTAGLVDRKVGMNAVARIISVASDGRARFCGRPFRSQAYAD